MDGETIVRALHVLGVVLWIGGVGFVTTVLLPGIRNSQAPGERVAIFERMEHRFANQARATTLLVGATGFYMVVVWDLWGRFTDPAYWWMHGMVLIWVIFTVMLFILEPLFLHRFFVERAVKEPKTTFAMVQFLHWVLLMVSLIVLVGAVVGSHGG